MIWGYILSTIGIFGFILAGRKVWWAWYVNVANQVLWLAYSIITQQWGFLAGVVFYSFVFIHNAVKWTKIISKRLLDDFCEVDTSVSHVVRWQISGVRMTVSS